MQVVDQNLQREYEQDDMILKWLTMFSDKHDNEFTSHKWLLETPPKRMIYYTLYGDILTGSARIKNVLDVGGGYTALTRLMVKNYDYTLLDIMAHDSHTLLNDTQKALGKSFWVNSDWYEFQTNGQYDVIIANDLFPNVDQRLELFLEKFIPICNEIRLALTYYNTIRWYTVKRVDADEIFHMVAWDGLQVEHVLKKYIDRIKSPKFEQLFQNSQSLFANNRQICLLTIQGERKYKTE